MVQIPLWSCSYCFPRPRSPKRSFSGAFVLNEFWRTTGFWTNLVSALLFGLVHLPGWYVLGNFSAPLVLATDFVGLVVFGTLFGLVMRKTGSL